MLNKVSNMNKEQESVYKESVYQEGYGAFLAGVKDYNNPYYGLDAESWSDGWDDACELDLKLSYLWSDGWDDACEDNVGSPD